MEMKKNNEELRERSAFFRSKYLFLSFSSLSSSLSINFLFFLLPFLLLPNRYRLLRSCFPPLSSLIECDFKFERLVGRDASPRATSGGSHPNRHGFPYEELYDALMTSRPTQKVMEVEGKGVGKGVGGGRGVEVGGGREERHGEGYIRGRPDYGRR